MRSLVKIVLVAFFVLFGQQAFGCVCHLLNYKNWVPVVERNIEYAPNIFLGRTIHSAKEFTTVQVIDVFKGDIKSDTVIQIKSDVYCSSFPKGLAIFYAVLEQDGIISLTACGISRSIESHTSSIMPPPPPPNFNGDTAKYYQEQNELLENQLQPLLIKNWINEYALLTAYRNNNPQTEPTKPNYKDYLSYIAIALSLLAVFIAIFKKQA